MQVQELRRKYPYFFLVIITLITIFVYFSILKILIIDLQPWQSTGRLFFLIIYHLVLFMLVWSVAQTIKTDPGKVPVQWGFSLNVAKKYCLICHTFKPDRTHHCSSCNRCALNMDHHCPWINTCIGFHNRKSFMLMLFYTVLMTLMTILAVVFSLSRIFEHLKSASFSDYLKLIMLVVAVVINCIIFVTILLFFKYHLQLIFMNYTTLQTLQLKRRDKDPKQIPSPYDIGSYYNWVQVFGRNTWTWLLPIFMGNEGPAGDGVLWPKNPNLTN